MNKYLERLLKLFGIHKLDKTAEAEIANIDETGSANMIVERPGARRNREAREAGEPDKVEPIEGHQAFVETLGNYQESPEMQARLRKIMEEAQKRMTETTRKAGESLGQVGSDKPDRSRPKAGVLTRGAQLATAREAYKDTGMLPQGYKSDKKTGEIEFDTGR